MSSAFSVSPPLIPISWLGQAGVRDHLGESTPYLYLCGLLELSQSERRLFEHKRIIPVDLAPLFPRTQYPNASVRHARALEWFLLNLAAGAGQNVLSWPRLSMKNTTGHEPSADLPEVPAWPTASANVGKTCPIGAEITREDLLELLASWRESRKRYPGWVMCPKENREILWCRNGTLDGAGVCLS